MNLSSTNSVAPKSQEVSTGLFQRLCRVVSFASCYSKTEVSPLTSVAPKGTSAELATAEGRAAEGRAAEGRAAEGRAAEPVPSAEPVPGVSLLQKDAPLSG